jgi:hypothetical protein
LFDKVGMDVDMFMDPEDKKTLLPVVKEAELIVICLDVCIYTVSPASPFAAAKPLAGLFEELSAL